MPAELGLSGGGTALREGPVVAVQCALLSQRGGGLPAAVLPLVERMRRYHMRLVTFDPPEEASAAEVAVARRGFLPFASDAQRWSSDAALVHTHGLWSAMSPAALAFRRSTHRPTIVSPHGMLDSWALRRSHWKKRAALALFERRHLQTASIVHALSAAEERSIREAGVRSPVAVIPNGVDVVRDEAIAAPEWMDRPTLLFLGRLHEKKGIRPLIEAWSRASNKLPGWQLAIAGWDDGGNQFRQAAERSHGRIVFPGSLYGETRKAAYMNAAAFVLPSLSEGLPMTVLEAWAHGAPVFMTAECNLPEGFQAGAALPITARPQELAEALVGGLTDSDWLRAASIAGRRLAASSFSWDSVVNQWRDVYDWVLGEGAMPSCVKV